MNKKAMKKMNWLEYGICVFLLAACVPATQPVPSAPPPSPTVTPPAPTPELVANTPEPDSLTIWGWQLHLLGSENVVSAGLSLRLHEDGGLTGFTGCRPFQGVYRVADEGF
jgi:heat shock protein HslJ